MRILPGPIPTVEIGEWETVEHLDRLQLSARDRSLAAALSDGERRLVVEELRDGLRLRSSSWIGVVRFESFEVRVVPKLVGGNLGVVEMVDYASGLGALARFSSVRRLAAERDGRLVDLLALLLAEAAERIVRDGLLSDYVTREESLGILRGRLMFANQVRRRFGQIDRLECRFDELETDIAENRLLAVGLGLARTVASDPEVRRRVTRMANILSEACDPDAFEAAVAERELDYHRRNEHYRTAHSLAWLFVRRLAVKDVFSPGAGQSFAFMLDMNRLFEDFVTRLLGDLFAGTDVGVTAQRRDRSLIVNEETWRPYAAVIPDVLLERRGATGLRRVPVDAKYKLYDERRLDVADIYQTFFYGYAYAGGSADGASDAEAYLVYPATQVGHGLKLRVLRRDGVTSARIRAIAIDVPAALDAVRAGRQQALPALAPLRARLLDPQSESVALS